MPAQPTRARAVSTPDPEEEALRVSVDPALIKQPSITVGTLYKDAPNYFDKTLVALGYGLYEYTYKTDGNGTIEHFFAKPKGWSVLDSDGEIIATYATEVLADAASSLIPGSSVQNDKMTPFRVTDASFGNHYHPAILLALNLQEDPSFPASANIISGSNQGIVTAPRYYQQDELINDVSEGSRFVLSEFFGPNPYGIPRYPVPQPGRVAFQTPTLSGSFPECLHDDITIPPTRTGTSQNAGGTTTAVGGSLDGQFFPRTGFKRRRPYVTKAAGVQRDGGWYYYTLRVYPPRLSRRIFQNS